jgi:8-oxo-dGTP diphosphatase
MDWKIMVEYNRDLFENAELNLSVDCVIFTIKEDSLRVLLTKIAPDSDWMLPGGFIKKDEEADLAAMRILLQRTGLSDIYLQQFKIFSDPDRFAFNLLNMDEIKDTSHFPDRVISIGYFALVNFEALRLTGGLLNEDTVWADVEEPPELLFDHNDIVRDAREALRKELFYRPIAYNLLPEKFTMPQLQKLYEIILDRALERSSFQKRMLKWDIYERLEERKEGVAHKRPYLYRFDEKKYQEALKRGLRFGI